MSLDENANRQMASSRRCLLLRMHYTHAGDLRNSIIKHLSILQGYHGTCIGIGHEAYPIRHGRRRWHDHLAIALFDFESEAWLKLWVESEPDLKQRDYLDGLDIISVPFNQHIDAVSGFDEPWLCIAESAANCPYTTVDDLKTLSQEALSDMGTCVTVITPDSHNHYRGLYNPDTMVATFCDGKGSRTHVPSVEEAPYSLPEVDVILFKLQPLCLPVTMDTNPAAMCI